MNDIEADKQHERWMQAALQQAELARGNDEVPIGAVLVAGDAIIGVGRNQVITSHDASAHAEICALRQASQNRQNYRLPGTTLYVTIEPCTMCVGALIHARVERVVFGARESRAGAVVSQQHLLNEQFFNHRVSYIEGILREQCADLVQDFFQRKRKSK